MHFLSPNVTVSTSGDKSSTNGKALKAARSEARSFAARVSHACAKGPRPLTRKVRIPNFTTEGLDSPSLSAKAGSNNSTSRTTSTSGKTELILDSRDKSKPCTTLPFLRFPLHVGNGKNSRVAVSQLSPKASEDGLERSRERATSVPTKLPKQMRKSALDSFFSPPLDLSVPDEQLLHVYLSTVPDQIH